MLLYFGKLNFVQNGHDPEAAAAKLLRNNATAGAEPNTEVPKARCCLEPSCARFLVRAAWSPWTH